MTLEKSLATLIKLTQQDLDNKRRDLNVFLDKKEALLKKKQDLLAALEIERERAATQADAAYAFTNFLINTRVQVENLDKAVQALEPFIIDLQNQIAEAFGELKKYDILLERKQLEALKEQERKETIRLDDIALQQYLRKEENSG